MQDEGIKSGISPYDVWFIYSFKDLILSLKGNILYHLAIGFNKEGEAKKVKMTLDDVDKKRLEEFARLAKHGAGHSK